MRATSERLALLVCSSDIQAEMFAPIDRELRVRGWKTRTLSLDQYYSQGASERSRALGLPYVELPRSSGNLGAPFYARPFVQVWADVLRARVAVSDLLRSFLPDVVLFGNDYGLVEKLILYAARARGSRLVLVQDGVLGRTSRPPTAGWWSALTRGARRLFSPILRAIGLPYLAASNYGASPVDLICANGRLGVEYFEGLGISRTRLVITGQPRYDELFDRQSADPRDVDRWIVFFTTPFAMQGLGDEPQRRQAILIEALGNTLGANGLKLVVKSHPREVAPKVPDGVVVSRQRSADLLRRAAVAIIGISTVVEEAVLLGVPVLVPGMSVHGSRFDDFLPPPDHFPRFESSEEALSIIRAWQNPGRRQAVAEGQLEYVHASADVQVSRTAASRVADAVESMGVRLDRATGAVSV